MIAIAREYFPNYSDDDLGFILWNETAFPLNVMRDGVEEPIRLQLAALAAKLANDPDYVLGSSL